MLITKIFTFSAAHFLPNYCGKCEHLHGHTYKLEVTAEGNPGEDGLIIDFNLFKKIIKKEVLDQIDHTLLNDIIPNPSAENTVKWILARLKNLPKLLTTASNDKEYLKEIARYQKKNIATKTSPKKFAKIKLKKITLWENPTSYVTIEL